MAIGAGRGQYLSPEEYARMRRQGLTPMQLATMSQMAPNQPAALIQGGRGVLAPYGVNSVTGAALTPGVPPLPPPVEVKTLPPVAEAAAAAEAPAPVSVPAEAFTPVSAAMRGSMMSPGALSQVDPQQAMYDGALQAGIGLLANANDPRKAMAAGFEGFNRGYDDRVASDRARNVPKVTPLANGAAALLQYPDGRVEVKPIEEVQKFLRNPYGKAPTGMRFDSNGNLEPIPGGPADDKAKKEREADAAKTRGAVAAADNVIGRVDKALEKTGFFTTGLTGAVTGMVPGTKSYDLRKDTETIKANLGFQQLQQMREASPTGGALGQVAVQELNALQAVVSNLDANQSEATLRENLSLVRKHYTAWKDAVTKAKGEAPAAGGGAAPASSVPQQFQQYMR